MSTIEYAYDPEGAGDFPLAEGATAGWLVLHQGIGPAVAVRAVAMTDADGHGFVEQQGEWRQIEVTER